MINCTIKALQDIREMSPPTFMARAGIAKGTYYNRLRGDGGGWTAAEVKRAADALGVSVATLYDGLLPHLDSNQKPAELRQRTNVVSLADYRSRRDPSRYAHRPQRRALSSTPQVVDFPTVSAAS